MAECGRTRWPHPGGGDGVDRAVQCPVAAPVQAVLLRAQPFGRALFLCMASAELYGQVPGIHVIPVGVPGPGSRYVVQVLRAGEGLTRRSGLLDRF